MGFANEETLFGGVKALRFEMFGDSIVDDLENPDTKCYCYKEKSCYRPGLGNIAPCSHSKKVSENSIFFLIFFLFEDFPIAVSLPHFYKGDPSLLNEVEGLKPDKEKHETFMVYQPVSKSHLMFIFD